MARGIRRILFLEEVLSNYPSVVQRQLWLMHSGGMSKSQSYDIARKEFYDLRQQEEIERRIAKEEAMWTGAYFGKSALEVGMELEDQAYEQWKEWAMKEVEALGRQSEAAYTGAGTPEEPEEELFPAESLIPELSESSVPSEL